MITDQGGVYDDGRTWDNDYDAAGRVDARREFDTENRLDTLHLYDDAGRRDYVWTYDTAGRGMRGMGVKTRALPAESVVRGAQKRENKTYATV